MTDLWRRHHCRWRAVKNRPMLGAQGLWAGRDLYLATPAVTRDLGFSGLIRMAACSIPLKTQNGVWRIYFCPDSHGSPFSHLLRHTRGYGGPFLTRIPTGIFIQMICRKNILQWNTTLVMKHKCPRTRQILEVAIIVKTQAQNVKKKIRFQNEGLVKRRRFCHKEKSYEIWKTYHLTIQKIWRILKFLKSGSNFNVKILVPIEISCHKKTYIINITGLNWWVNCVHFLCE
jgi:phage FluMu protein Com